MRLKSKDLLASILFAAIAVPYVGYLVNGEMPFIKDPRGMSATGLVLGVVAYLVMRRDDLFDRVGKAETALAGVVPRAGDRYPRPGRDGRRRGAAGRLHGLDPDRVGRRADGPRGHPARRWPPDRTAVSVTGRYTGNRGVARALRTPRRRRHTQIARCRASLRRVWRLPAAMREPLGLHGRPDEQPERCADDHADGNLGAAADQRSEDNPDRRAQCQPQSGCLGTSVGCCESSPPTLRRGRGSSLDLLSDRTP